MRRWASSAYLDTQSSAQHHLDATLLRALWHQLERGVLYSVRVTASAQVQIRTIGRWWVANRLAAPDLFDQEFSRAWLILQNAPYIGAQAPIEAQGYRRLLLKKSGYHVYYVIDEGSEVVEIHAVWRSARGSEPAL